MPARDQHIQQARDNFAFYQSRLVLSEAIDCQWAAVVLFYTGLHWVDAYFAALPRPIHPATHEIRGAWMAGDPNLAPINRHYALLEDRSQDARYRLKPFTEAEIRRLETQALDPLRTHVASLLGVPL